MKPVHHRSINHTARARTGIKEVHIVVELGSSGGAAKQHNHFANHRRRMPGARRRRRSAATVRQLEPLQRVGVQHVQVVAVARQTVEAAKEEQVITKRAQRGAAQRRRRLAFGGNL